MGRPSTWTPAHLARLEDIVVSAARVKMRINWADHIVELGHGVSSIQVKAVEIRARQRADMRDARLSVIRERPSPLPVAPTRSTAPDHHVATSTARLALDVEMRSRIAEQGITAGLFGDPPRGRSALDQRQRRADGKDDHARA